MQPKEKTGNVMWGGRFDAKPSEIMQDMNASIDFDKRLYKEDIAGSKAHCAMLIKQKIISEDDGNKILQGLETVLSEIESGSFVFSKELEDIHMNIEARLHDLIGEAAGKLHTARSRNDQVATDFRLWTKQAISQLEDALSELQGALNDQAVVHKDTVMPGFTHLQIAQPTKFGTHLQAYVQMLGRDKSRFVDCADRLNECPLGACALAGTSFPIDRDYTAQQLGFKAPMANTLDAVGSRDFALEFLSCASICSVHLSRLAEELILWSSSMFDFISLSDSFTTGSSIMPQKRNPDAAELIRAKIGRIAGSWNTLLIVQKALPLAYNKDLQEDKEPVFETADTLALTVAAMTGMFEEITFNNDKLLAAAKAANSNAIDLADWLVRELGKPFREAHCISGSMVKLAESKGCMLEELNLTDMQSVEPAITEDVLAMLDIEQALNARSSFGGPAPANVKEACAQARLKYLG
ncbi:MAG TPA: argininosuccinate lyase [Micavibrio sp.]|nr:argininosuccinate lyase [Micavibrio sp.]